MMKAPAALAFLVICWLLAMPLQPTSPTVLETIRIVRVEAVSAVWQTGVASWYGPGFHGRLAADGLPFDQGSWTLAHRSLPLGTIVALRNPANGRRAVGVVSDRGPFVVGRDMDLSRALAERLGFVRQGLALIELTVLDHYLTGGVDGR